MVLATCEEADLHGPGSASSAKGRAADLAAIDHLLAASSSSGVAILGCPFVSPAREAADGAGQRAFNEVAAQAAVTHPGKVAYLPVQSGLNLVGRYSRFLPPADQPTAAFGVAPWEIVRMTNGLNYCPSGAVRVVAASLGDLRTMGYELAPSGHWWHGDWTTGPAFTPISACSPG